MEAQQSIIAEVEGAIASGSSDKRVETLRRVTDLFMINAERYSEPQVGLFDDVISRLADQIEMKARAELANRLAPVTNAPLTVVRSLARDEAIEVAGPVLTHSPRLTEEDLLASIKSRSQARMLAISRRAVVSETVSDVLVEDGDQEVVRSVARNEGARFSNFGYTKLVERSTDDDVLAVDVGLRKDIPKEHFHTLVAKASEAAFKKLAASNPAAVHEAQRVLSRLTGGKPLDTSVRLPRDYSAAKAAIEAQLQAGLTPEAAVQHFASTGMMLEVIVAVANLCHLPPEPVERVFGDKTADSDLALLLIKAAGCSWPTAKLILELRAGEGGLSQVTVSSMHRQFDRLQLSTAQRVVRFYQVRQASNDKSGSSSAVAP